MLELVKPRPAGVGRLTNVVSFLREEKTMGQVSFLSIASLIHREFRVARLDPTDIESIAEGGVKITFWQRGIERTVAFFGTETSTDQIIYSDLTGREEITDDKIAGDPYLAWPALRDRIMRGQKRNN